VVFSALTHRFLLFTFAFLASNSLFPRTVSAQKPSSRNHPYCKAEQLTASTDGRKGDFNGMSHSGTLLILSNVGKETCEIGAMPSLRFADATGKLNTQAQSPLPPFVHPGPVVPNVVIAPGERITSALRWVSGPVFQDSVCIDPTQLSISVNGKLLQISFHGHLCGEREKGVLYQASKFTLAEP
jgi:hypothetical protein